jgi:hypothetical protein
MHNNIVELHVKRTDTGETLRLKGREAWTLAHLIKAGENGIIPLERPAPRWSAYVHTLRKRGLTIDTVDEPLAGPYSGTRATSCAHRSKCSKPSLPTTNAPMASPMW